MPKPNHTVRACYACGAQDFSFLFDKNGWRIEKCKACGFVFVNPRYSEADAGAIYNEAGWFFSGRSGDGKKNYALEELPSIQRAEKAVAKIRSFKNGPSLLDIGCGLGYVLDAGRKAGWRVTGIDISKEAVALCREKGHEAYAGSLHEAAPALTGKSFDIVTAFDVFEHICEPLEFLAGIRRIANPGALVVLAVPNVRCFSARARGKGWSQFILPEHINYFDSSTIRRILERSGFRVEEIHSEPSITLGLRPALRHYAKGILAKPVSRLVDAITRFKRYVFYPPINALVRKARLEANLLVVFATAL